jgi:hypothetical protein
MAIKVFVRDIDRADYVSVPADGFRLQGTYLVARSSGRTGDNGPVTDEMGFVFEFPLSSSPAGVYMALYQQVLADCAANGWETPAKTDIFGWIPMDFSLLIP